MHVIQTEANSDNLHNNLTTLVQHLEKVQQNENTQPNTNVLQVAQMTDKVFTGDTKK